MFGRFDILKHKGFNPSYIVDVGAHLGKFSLHCKELWPETDVLLIEANPYAEETLKQTNLPYKIGLLTDKVGEEYTYYMTNKWILSSGNSIYRENTSEFDDTHVIKTTLVSDTIDNLLRDRKIDLLKIDTQGSELKILNGAKESIKKTEYIFLECSIYEYNIGGCRVDDIFVFMYENGFRLVDIADISYINNDIDLNQMDLIFKKL